MKTLLIAGTLFSLSGCSILIKPNSLVPIPSANEFASFSGRLQGIGADQASLAELKAKLIDFIGEYHKLASERRKMEYDASGMTTYGGLAAVLGALADKTGLLNTGAATAGLGLAISSRYNFGQQSAVYFGAVRKLACINSKLTSVPDTVFSDAILSPDLNAAEIAKGAVRQIAGTVDAVRIEANNGILGIAPGVPSRDELLTMFRSYLPATTPVGGSAAPAAPDPDGVRRKEAGEQVKALLSEVSMCSKS